MINELHITNLAVIEDTLLNFDTNYTALIGETGAGKSLVVDSLGLVKGDKSDFSLVRDQQKKAVVTATFSLSKDFIEKHPEVKDYVQDDGSLIAKRVLLPDHTNRSYLNDEPVTLLAYRKAVSHLIDIHSQGANSDLLDESKHIYYLDRFGAAEEKEAIKDFSASYQSYLAKQKEVTELLESNKELDRDYLKFQIDEINKYNLKPNEIEDLNEEFASLKGYEEVKNRYEELSEAMVLSEGNILDILYQIESRLSQFNSTSLKEDALKARSKCSELIDSFKALKEDYQNLNSDPKRIDEINQRLFDLKGLERKYGKTTSEILNKLHDYQNKLDQLDSFESLKQEKEKEVKKLLDECLSKAKILSELRKKTSLKLEKAIGNEMSDLGLIKDGFRVHLKEASLNSLGIDKVTFEVALNVGLGYAPLAKAASGGESSRLMLALKTVLNALDPYDLLVFDEVDTGVSGRIASLVAKKISSISKSSQVLVVSHLPQVVASSFSQLKITKITKNGQTFTTAKVIDKKDNCLEVAKMISGDQVTDSAIKQAQELIGEFHK